MSANNSIKVVARFRPQNKIELASGGQPIVSFDGEDTCTVDVSSDAIPGEEEGGRGPERRENEDRQTDTPEMAPPYKETTHR
jgi:hypothetical protein